MKLFLTVILLCLYLVSPAQTGIDTSDVPDTTITPENAASDVEEEIPFSVPVPRRLSADSVKAIKEMEEFAYMQNIDSFFRNRKMPREPAVTSNTKNSRTLFTNPGLRTLYWLVAFLLVMIIIWKMLIGKNALFSTNRKLVAGHSRRESTGAKPQTNEEHALSAMASGNFRLAVRHLYIDVLEILGKKGLLVIAPQKTDYQYVQELDDDTLQKSFALLTMHYEYTWFGEFNINHEQFNTIHTAFQNFKSSLE